MSNTIHALAQQLSGKASVKECSLDEAQQIAQRYPYFAPAQFLLVLKLKEIDSPDLESQQRKAVLFFHDPIQFQYFISSDKFYFDEVVVENETDLQPLINDHKNIITDNSNEENYKRLSIVGDSTENLIDVEDTSTNGANKKQDVALSNTDLSKEHVPEEISDDILPGTTEGLTVPQATFPKNTSENIDIDNSSGILSPQIESETTATGSVAEQKETTHSPKDELAFEPYYSVDYFASQGIKVSQEGPPNDRLEKQLKSFTDWLKTMKRLPAVHVIEQVELIAEKKIENMASRSVSESTVITEAMAEVWAKQGNKEKAAETYNKLSLLNPSKKAFFAAKIENLKTS